MALTATDRRKHIAFVASRISGPSRHGKHLALTSFVAAATRRRGRIEEGAIAANLFDAGHYFRLHGPEAPISEAVLKPPPPFSGSATYLEGPAASQRWTGDLKVALPGFGDVPLTGHGVRVRTCEGLACGLGFALTSSLAERLPLPRLR